MSDYLFGSDVVGAVGPGPFILVHLRDVPETVRSQAGAALGLGARALSTLVPGGKDFTDMKVHQYAADLAKGELQKRGIEADVTVVEKLPVAEASMRRFFLGTAVGAVVVLVASAAFGK